MSQKDEPRAPETPQAEAPRPYEPPRLIPLGNLRDLAAKSGAAFDQPNPHSKRP